jgi:hypothetical protein
VLYKPSVHPAHMVSSKLQVVVYAYVGLTWTAQERTLQACFARLLEYSFTHKGHKRARVSVDGKHQHVLKQAAFRAIALHAQQRKEERAHVRDVLLAWLRVTQRSARFAVFVTMLKVGGPEADFP